MSSQPEATLEQGTSYTYDFPPLELLEQQRETDDSKAAAEMRKKLLFEHHIFTGGAGATTVRLLPALTLTKEQVDIFITNFKELI